MTYLLQVSTCWIVFFGIYLLFLRKETFFNINRYYLLGALATGLLVPYLGAFIPANEASVEVYQVMTQFSAVEVMPQAYTEEATPIFTWMNLLWAVYIIGAFVVFSRFIYGLNRIYAIYKEADKTPQTNYTLVESDKYHLPFSFFHFIFISKQLPLNEEVDKVLRHEELHANQWHSLDIVFTELLQVFFWFNPILIFYKNALRQSHEYLADAYVTQDHNKNSYGQLLLQQSTSGLEVALANQFFHSQIKKRITMMYKEKSKRSAMVKYLAAVPVLVAMLIIFSSNQVGEGYSKEELLNYFDKDFKNLISVNENGDYFLDDKTLSIDLIPDVLENIKSLQKNLILEVNPASKNEFVVKILDLAYENDVLVTLRTSGINGEETLKPYKKELEELHENKYGLKAKMGGTQDQIISVLENGVYLFKNIPLSEEKTRSLLILIKEADGKLFINTQEGVQWNYVSRLLASAAQLGVQSVINDQSSPENFDGRKFLSTDFSPLVNIKTIEKDKLIFLNATADKKGNIVFVEVDKKNSDALDINYLKKTLFTVKNFKLEPGEREVTGSIAINTNVSHIENWDIFGVNQYNPQSAFTYSKDNDVFRFDNEINLGEQVPEGSIKLRAEGSALREGEDYKIDYTLGKLQIINKELLKSGTPINVSFEEDNDDPIFKVVEEMPRFPGCEDMYGSANEKEQCAKQKMLEFVYSNLKYPAKARDANVEGMCVVQFVVEKDGSVAEAKIVRDIGADCGVETMKVINSFPNWIPGKQRGKAVRVQYTLPVKFKLEGDDKPSKIEDLLKGKTSGVAINGDSDREIRLKTSNSNQPEPLYVIDGIIQEGSPIESINPDDIKSMNIVKGDRATEKYGEAGKNGVIEITLKSNESEKKYTYKTSLKYTASQFKEINDISYILRDIGLKRESKSEVLKFSLVKVAEKEDAYIEHSKTGNFNQRMQKLISEAKITDRYFFENIVLNIDGKEENIGALSIMIVDGMPSLVRPLTIVNGKKVASDWINNINPDDIEKIEVLKGEKLIKKHGDIPHNSVIEITLKPGKKLTKYLIDGKLFGYDFYRKINKSHIENERTGTKEEKFMRGMKEDLIVVTLSDEFGLSSAYFPETDTKESSDEALLDFVGKNISYPKSAIDNEIEGVVTVRYTVKENGELTDFEIVKSLGWGLDEVVLDMMDKLAEEKGSWSAAQLDQKSIATSMILPVKFKLQSDQKKEAKSNRLNTIKFSTNPNPSNGNFNVVYQLDKNIPVNLTFYSIDGKTIKRMLNLPAENNINVDLSNHNLPLIYITLEQEGKTKTIKAAFQN